MHTPDLSWQSRDVILGPQCCSKHLKSQTETAVTMKPGSLIIPVPTPRANSCLVSVADLPVHVPLVASTYHAFHSPAVSQPYCAAWHSSPLQLPCKCGCCPGCERPHTELRKGVVMIHACGWCGLSHSRCHMPVAAAGKVTRNGTNQQKQALLG